MRQRAHVQVVQLVPGLLHTGTGDRHSLNPIQEDRPHLVAASTQRGLIRTAAADIPTGLEIMGHVLQSVGTGIISVTERHWVVTEGISPKARLVRTPVIHLRAVTFTHTQAPWLARRLTAGS